MEWVLTLALIGLLVLAVAAMDDERKQGVKEGRRLAEKEFYEAIGRQHAAATTAKLEIVDMFDSAERHLRG